MEKTVKLELMDWKAVEKSAQAEIRRAKMELILHEQTLRIARKQIKSFGGLIMEEEKEQEKKSS